MFGLLGLSVCLVSQFSPLSSRIMEYSGGRVRRVVIWRRNGWVAGFTRILISEI